MKTHILFTHSPLFPTPAQLDSRETGAVAEFWGIVREAEGALTLQGLHYEAYIPMAEKLLSRLLHEIAQIHPCHCVEFAHRLGWVPVGEASLWIRVQSRHRAQAFAFMAESITRLKTDVPVWKMIQRPL